MHAGPTLPNPRTLRAISMILKRSSGWRRPPLRLPGRHDPPVDQVVELVGLHANGGGRPKERSGRSERQRMVGDVSGQMLPR
jgi:hypothetical protein